MHQDLASTFYASVTEMAWVSFCCGSILQMGEASDMLAYPTAWHSRSKANKLRRHRCLRELGAEACVRRLGWVNGRKVRELALGLLPEYLQVGDNHGTDIDRTTKSHFCGSSLVLSPPEHTWSDEA